MPCDDAAPDSGLQQDTCISVNDGPQPNWWLSPDIVLNGTLKDGTITGLAPDQAFINADNKVDVNVNRAATATCQLPEGTANIIIEVWVSPPGLNLSPFGAKQISSALTMPLSQLPANSHKALSQIGKQITWTPTSTNPGDPDGPGHRCLIARCYPDAGGSPDPDCFHVTGDAHVAQRNIEIKQVSIREPRMRAQIRTGNTNREAVEPATLRVVADLNPDPRVIDILTPALKATPGYQRVVRRASTGFGLQLPDFPNAKVRDNTRPGCLSFIFKLLSLLGFKGFGFEPSYEADVQLKPGQVTNFTFTADLSGSRPGDAYIFHLTHVRADQQVIGGLTLAAVMS